jgi:hypothetical protein
VIFGATGEAVEAADFVANLEVIPVFLMGRKKLMSVVRL